MDIKKIGNGIFAHRGNMSVFPENTMESFISAIEEGADWIELDIQKTKDGHLVVTHDLSTERVTNEKFIVTNSNLIDLKKLNFGINAKDNKFYELPVLGDVFQLINKYKKIKVTIQPKNNGLIKDTIQLADKFNVLNNIAFNDINCEYLIEAKQIYPQIPVFWDRLPNTDFETDLFIAHQFNFDCLMYLKEGLNNEKTQKIKQEGFVAGACVVNDLNEMINFIEMGVDAFYTDYPGILFKLKNQNNGK